MLIRNESRIAHTIHIKLVFDDNRTRELDITECDRVQVSYRKNGCIRQGVGIIREIKPHIHTKKWSFCKQESAIITLDMSEDLVSCVDKFDMNDIIDIRKLRPPCTCECPKCEEQIEPDFPVTKPRCLVGGRITHKGVVICE